MKESFFLKTLFFFYQLLWVCATPFLLRSPRLKEGAEERTLKKVNFSKVDIWMHAASVGEAYIARQLLKNFEDDLKLKILITTNTSQGKNILEKDLAAEQRHAVSIAYMVFDNPTLVKKAIRIADPKLLVLIELEIWPALMAEIKRQKKKMIIVNGRMTEKSYKGYKKTAFLWKRLAPDIILANSEENKKRLQDLFQQKRSYYVSNIKFDQIKTCTISKKTVTKDRTLILASIRKEEESEVFYLITELLKRFPDLHIDLFPRHLARVSNWKTLLTESHISCALKSASSLNAVASVLIWDIFGELLNAYRRADAAFIGGSLAPLGGQNFIEAFMNGVTPVTGPSISNFLWAGNEVFESGLVKKGSNKEEVLKLLEETLRNPEDKATIQQKANKYIQLKQGGSRKTCRHIVDLLQHSDVN